MLASNAARSEKKNMNTKKTGANELKLLNLLKITAFFLIYNEMHYKTKMCASSLIFSAIKCFFLETNINLWLKDIFSYFPANGVQNTSFYIYTVI